MFKEMTQYEMMKTDGGQLTGFQTAVAIGAGAGLSKAIGWNQAERALNRRR